MVEARTTDIKKDAVQSLKNESHLLFILPYFVSSAVQVLKTLLEVGARPDAKDQEESAPLHIAAQ
jgi:hypothetical protein